MEIYVAKRSVYFIELTLFYVSSITHEHIINVKGMKIFRNCPTKQDSFLLHLYPK